MDYVEQLFVGGGGAMLFGRGRGGIGAEDDLAIEVAVAIFEREAQDVGRPIVLEELAD